MRWPRRSLMDYMLSSPYYNLENGSGERRYVTDGGITDVRLWRLCEVMLALNLAVLVIQAGVQLCKMIGGPEQRSVLARDVA